MSAGRANLAEYRGNVYTDSQNLSQNNTNQSNFTSNDHSQLDEQMQNPNNMHRDNVRDGGAFGSANSVRFTDDSVIGFVSTVAAPASSSVENRITLADNLRLAEDHEVVGYANVAHLIAGDDQIQETASQLEQ